MDVLQYPMLAQDVRLLADGVGEALTSRSLPGDIMLDLREMARKLKGMEPNRYGVVLAPGDSVRPLLRRWRSFLEWKASRYSLDRDGYTPEAGYADALADALAAWERSDSFETVGSPRLGDARLAYVQWMQPDETVEPEADDVVRDDSGTPAAAVVYRLTIGLGVVVICACTSLAAVERAKANAFTFGGVEALVKIVPLNL
jgi:hypothetical protein